MTEELKPCPFCGGPAQSGKWSRVDPANPDGFAIECGSDLYDCPVNPSVARYDKAEAIAAWNRRAFDDLALLSLLADIRKAAGDAEGRLMQDELVAHIAALRADAERWQWLRNRPYGGLQVLAWASEGNTLDIRHACDLDELIDAARAAK